MAIAADTASSQSEDEGGFAESDLLADGTVSAA
jgi:hypothetical protein